MSAGPAALKPGTEPAGLQLNPCVSGSLVAAPPDAAAAATDEVLSEPVTRRAAQFAQRAQPVWAQSMRAEITRIEGHTMQRASFVNLRPVCCMAIAPKGNTGAREMILWHTCNAGNQPRGCRRRLLIRNAARQAVELIQ